MYCHNQCNNAFTHSLSAIQCQSTLFSAVESTSVPSHTIIWRTVSHSTTHLILTVGRAAQRPQTPAAGLQYSGELLNDRFGATDGQPMTKRPTNRWSDWRLWLTDGAVNEVLNWRQSQKLFGTKLSLELKLEFECDSNQCFVWFNSFVCFTCLSVSIRLDIEFYNHYSDQW